MASHQRGGGGRGGGRGQPNPNVAQGGYGGGRGGGRGGYQGGRGDGGYQGGGRGEGGGGYQGGRGDGGYYQGGRGDGGGRGGGGYYQGGRGEGGGRGGYQGGRGEGGGRGGGYPQGGRDGGGGRGRGGYYQGGRGDGGGYQGGRGDGYQGRGGRGGGYDYGRGGGGGRGGPSQPPVRRPAGPPLAERYKAQAMDLVEKFKTMSIHRDTPMFPPRPGFGVAGTPCLVTANHFFTGVVDKGLHHYDVAITPEPTLKAVYRKIISKLVTDHETTDFGGRLPAYDGSRSLFTAGELPFKSKQFDVTLAGRDDRKYTVAIKHATVVSLDQLMMLMGGRATDIPMQALQVLDIVLRDIVLNERQDMGYLAVGRSFFSPVIDVPTDLGQGVQGWKGFYQSIRPTQNGLSVVLDISSTAFIEPLPLIDFVKKILGKNPAAPFTAITSVDYVKMKKALRGVRIEVTHRGDQRRKYKIADLTLTRTSQLTFEASPGVSKTVVEYFRETYGLNLQYDFLPSVQVGSEQRPNYLPMEVCKIVPGQHYKKKLDDTQVKALMSSTCRRPNDREKDICRIVERNEYNSTRRANEFGIEVDYNPTSVQARILPAPTLKYHATGSETSCCPEKGSWNMRSKKVVDGARIRNWACVNFCGTLQQNEAQNFCSQLARMCSNSGVRIDSNPRMFRITSPNTEAELRGIHQTMWTSLGGQKIDLLLAILPNGNGSLYGNLKRICETEIGLMSQCCLEKNVRNSNATTLANIALKINAKVGGRNTVLADPLPVVSNKTTIIFGADVTHPSALDDTAPSIASVVASLDWPEVAKYNGVVHAQGHRVEIINGLEDIVKELLLSFQKENGKPQQLIFYRDGVSEGQFKQVLEQEIPEIEKAWKALYNEEPNITFIIVQKRHHTRLFPSDHRYRDNSGNVLPGIVVDRNICHPTEFDFFLCSHAGIIGTSRPTHYHVLRDDNKFTADSLQSLTYNLCYTYSSCCRSVSIAPPAYYAHKLAFRARMYMSQASDAASVSSHASSAHAAAPRKLPEIKNELKRFMFYC